MLMYLPIGKHYKVLIEAENMEFIANAQEAIKEKYGEDFFKKFYYKDNFWFLHEDIWQALIEIGYPEYKIRELNHVLYPLMPIEGENLIEREVSRSLLTSMYIWLLDEYGAEIWRIVGDFAIPTISEYTCNGFETIGQV